MFCLLAGPAYWAFLTVLLLTPDPAVILRLDHLPMFWWGELGIHSAAFTILALLVHGLRWPRAPGWTMLFVLLVYAIAVESLQAFVPPRTVELLDYLENLFGILLGSGIYGALSWPGRWSSRQADKGHEVLKWIISADRVRD